MSMRRVAPVPYARRVSVVGLTLLLLACPAAPPAAAPPTADVVVSGARTTTTTATTTTTTVAPRTHTTTGAGDQAGDALPPYVLTGDLEELRVRGALRFLVPDLDEFLPRGYDPFREELQLARDLAARLGLRAVFVPVADGDALLPALTAGHGDVVVASLTITPERLEQVAFTRPLRFVKQLLVAHVADTSVRSPADLAGKAVTVRPSSAHARALSKLAIAGLEITPAPEDEDTLDLLSRVARREIAYTVADSDVVEAARGYESDLQPVLELSDRDAIAWAVRKTSPELKRVLDEVLVESALTSHRVQPYRADLPALREKRVLRVITRNAASCFFLHRGEPMGFEYELVRELARQLDLRLEVVIAPSREALWTYLEEGKGDLIAAGLTITEDRQARVDFSVPYLRVAELLVVPASDTTTGSLDDLRGRVVSVRRSSSYYQTLSARRAELDLQLEALPETQETEEILRRVGRGELAATVADSNIVALEQSSSDTLRVVAPLGEPVPLAWALRKDQPELRRAVDAYLRRIDRGTFYNMTVSKYFRPSPRSARPALSARRGQLSPYDRLVQKHAATYELDWRLITAQMYQESRFDPHAKSWVGARGLMQIMPTTARELGARDVLDPDQGIEAGTRLLARYARQFALPHIREKDRLRFALAAYNCGPGHVHDARRLARDLGLDANRWFGGVEKAMALLAEPRYARRARHGYCRCAEPIKYVSEIQTRYDGYTALVGVR
jgi:membrane-bound lytic murein transglycosylase F